MSNEPKFETFWSNVSTGPYEFPEEMKLYLYAGLKEAGFFDVQAIQIQSQSGTTLTKHKKLSGYNVFMKTKMAELREQNVPSGERMGKIGYLWKNLNEEEKTEWKNKASNAGHANAEHVTVNVSSTKSNRPKKISGYQLYVKEIMPSVKAQTDLPAKKRMTEIGRMWKALQNEERNAYNIKAIELPF